MFKAYLSGAFYGLLIVAAALGLTMMTAPPRARSVAYHHAQACDTVSIQFRDRVETYTIQELVRRAQVSTNLKPEECN